MVVDMNGELVGKKELAGLTRLPMELSLKVF